MKDYLAVLACAILLAVVGVFASNASAGESTAKIRIIRGGSQPTRKGNSEHYTGSVMLDHPFRADEPGRHGGEYVSYEPGARSAWHTHPAGERVFVAGGKLLVQEVDGPVMEVLPGEVVWFPPNVKHWHGSAPDMATKTLSFFEHVDGQTVTWLEKVSDAEYSARDAGKKSQFIEISVPSADSSGQAPVTRFTGTVRTDQIFAVKPGARSYGGIVTFEPGARTFWHTHPFGQTLIVTMGRGIVGQWGEPSIAVREGDIVFFPPEVKHFHSAAPETGFVTISMSERTDDVASTNWLEQVTDAQFFGATDAKPNQNVMPARLQKIALIAAFTASGDIDRLKKVQAEGLDAGLTVNEIKEVITHLYAYTGFPRALNSMIAFMAVLDERAAKGIKDEVGVEANEVTLDKNRYDYGYAVLQQLRNTTEEMPLSRTEQFAPTMERFLKEHLFADLFMRDNLDFLSREITTVGALSNLPGTNAQFRSHINIAMNMGASERQMRHLFSVMGSYFGKELEENALGVLETVLESRKK